MGWHDFPLMKYLPSTDPSPRDSGYFTCVEPGRQGDIPMSGRQLFALALFGFGGIAPAQLLAQVTVNKSASREEPVGSLRAPDLQAVRNQAAAWFRESGQASAAANQKFEALWKEENLTLL